MNIFVIADDFTGAGDVGIQLKKYGLNVKAYMDVFDFDIELKKNSVSVIDTDTRNKNKEYAKEKIKKLMNSIKNKKIDKFYKKIDSTLRGNLKEEIEVIAESIAQNEKICIIAAFPKVGRKTINGVHYVNEVPVSESEFSKDPLSPVKNDKFYEIFEKSKMINLKAIRNNLEETLLKTNEKIIIFDAETENDLDKIAEIITKIGYDKYIAGSAGIMNYLPKYWGFEKNRVFMISGSCSEKNMEQIEEFRKNVKQEIYFYKIDYSLSIEKNIDNLNKNYNGVNDILIISVDNKNDYENTFEIFNNKKENQNFLEFVEKYIVEISKNILERYKIKNIFLTGGETAVKVLKELKLKFLRIEDEIETGVVYFKNIDEEYRIITKPGAFGGNKIYIKAYEKLKNVENID